MQRQMVLWVLFASLGYLLNGPIGSIWGLFILSVIQVTVTLILRK